MRSRCFSSSSRITPPAVLASRLATLTLSRRPSFSWSFRSCGSRSGRPARLCCLSFSSNFSSFLQSVLWAFSEFKLLYLPQPG